MAEQITLTEAARRSGVSAETLRRWQREGIIPLDDGRWTDTAAAQARVIARMRERGHSLDSLREASSEGRLAFGLTEGLFAAPEEPISVEEAAQRTGLEPELVERVMRLLGTPAGREDSLASSM